MIDEKSMTLAIDWHGQVAIDGWLCSEKWNGCRAYFDGRQFWTRSGNIVAAPKWFVRGLPKMHLDGEIYCGRDGKRGDPQQEKAKLDAARRRELEDAEKIRRSELHDLNYVDQKIRHELLMPLRDGLQGLEKISSVQSHPAGRRAKDSRKRFAGTG